MVMNMSKKLQVQCGQEGEYMWRADIASDLTKESCMRSQEIYQVERLTEGSSTPNPKPSRLKGLPVAPVGPLLS